MTMAGDIFGISEQGAVTRIATAPTAGVTVMNCAVRNFGASTYRDFVVNGAAQARGVIASGFQLRQAAAQLMTNLNFASRVRFVTQIRFS